jgi:hypothetical protein
MVLRYSCALSAHLLDSSNDRLGRRRNHTSYLLRPQSV